jgi:hypothetical protein
MTKRQLEQLWVQQGGNPSAAPMAAAIALAESAGNPNAENHNTNGSTDRGLWQVNSIWGALSTFSPTGNARAAIAISKNGTNWSPWTTYKTGAYQQFLGGPGEPNTPPQAQTTTPTASSTSNPLIPPERGTGKALSYLLYAVLFTVGAGVAYQGIKHATREPQR